MDNDQSIYKKKSYIAAVEAVSSYLTEQNSDALLLVLTDKLYREKINDVTLRLSKLVSHQDKSQE